MEENNQQKERLGTKISRFHDKYYKLLLIIPAVILLFSLFYLVLFYSQHGDFAKRDISLTGGTSITLFEKISVETIQTDLSGKLEEIDAKEVYDIITREQKAIIIETKSDANTARIILEDYLGYSLNEENSSFEFTGSSLSESFFKQLIIAVIVAFVLMAIVVFILFRTIIPSTAVIICAFADLIMTLTLFNMLGMKLSSAGIVAFLMLIGYSVDTDILLTKRVFLKQDLTLNRKIWGAFKTGITMTLTSLFAIILAFIIVGPFSGILTQIFIILIIGLIFDIFNTWITNASIIKWYALKKNLN